MAKKSLKTRKVRKLDVKVDKQALVERLWTVDQNYKAIEEERKALRKQLTEAMKVGEKVAVENDGGSPHVLTKTSRTDKTIDVFWLAEQITKRKFVACVNVSNAKVKQQLGEKFLAEADGSTAKVESVRWS